MNNGNRADAIGKDVLKHIDQAQTGIEGALEGIKHLAHMTDLRTQLESLDRQIRKRRYTMHLKVQVGVLAAVGK
jgi:hypothetical protein